MIRKTIILLAAATVVLATGACNTVKGLGNDIESVGRGGEKAIN
jgi:predicted small secreted protein